VYAIGASKVQEVCLNRGRS